MFFCDCFKRVKTKVLILFRMLPIRLKYLDPIIKKKVKINFEKIKNSK